MATKEELNKRIFDAIAQDKGPTSDTYNLRTYAPEKMSYKQAEDALESADSEKERERNRGVKEMRKGGKVAGKLATRGYGKSR